MVIGSSSRLGRCTREKSDYLYYLEQWPRCLGQHEVPPSHSDLRRIEYDRLLSRSEGRVDSEYR